MFFLQSEKSSNTDQLSREKYKIYKLFGHLTMSVYDYKFHEFGKFSCMFNPKIVLYIEHFGEGIFGRRSYNAKFFERIEHSGSR